MTSRRQRGFGLVEQMVVTFMGAIFILFFIHGTLIVLDRYFSVQSVTDFDEERQLLRAQVNSWASRVFKSEVYLSNELLAQFNIVNPSGNILPYTGSFGSGLSIQSHVIFQNNLAVLENDPSRFDVVFVLMRDPAKTSLTVVDDTSATMAFANSPGLYRFNRIDPYVYVDNDPTDLKVGDFVALNSVGGAGFSRVKSIQGRKITFDFSGLGVFRPDDPVMKEGPFVVFYKGGTIIPFSIMVLGVSVDDLKNPTAIKMFVGRMNPVGSESEITPLHQLELPIRKLHLIRGSVSSIPGDTFVPFQTPQQLAATMVVPSFLSTRVSDPSLVTFFDQEITFLVPL